jgi:hypothetical protein
MYNGVTDCNAQDNTEYQVISKDQPYGASQCYTIGAPMPDGTRCFQFTQGGMVGPNDCSDSFAPVSVFAHEEDDGGSCALFSDAACKQDIIHAANNCVDASFLTSGKIGSFMCNVSSS